MKVHAVGAIAAVAAMVGAVVLAAPASAATTVNITCTESSITLYGQPGDEYDLTSGGSCTSDWEVNNVLDYSGSGISNHGWLRWLNSTGTTGGNTTSPTGAWYQYFANLGASATVTVRLLASNTNGASLTAGAKIAELDNDGAGPPTSIIAIVYGGVTPPSDAGTSDSQQEPWFLSVGREGETCPSGWSPSWAQWPNEGRGGPVCNSFLVYSDAQWWSTPDPRNGERRPWSSDD
jgi:hypothetical protein